MIADFPELAELEKIIERIKPHAKIEVLDTIEYKTHKFPLYSIALGNLNPAAPTLAVFGGVHGLERIGSKVALSYLKTLCGLLDWDDGIHHTLSKIRIVFMPLVNPVGMWARTRSNGNGVDLMRNAPVEAEGVSKLFLPGGQRFSNKLPWFRGKNGEMEKESLALCSVVEKYLYPAPVAIALDVHSGFGSIDRLWFPYARTRKPIDNYLEMFALKNLLDSTYPNHVYRVEPQSQSYLTHGDLWDFLYDRQRKLNPGQLFLPLTLEMGSWNWIKKNPTQLFSLLGPFNPNLPHRSRRTLRRHIPLFDFLQKAISAYPRWLKFSETTRKQWEEEAKSSWYAEVA